MPSIEDITNEISRRTMILFFLIDTSGSMNGEKIGAVNAGMEDTILDIREITNSDAQVKIAVLEFSTGTKWQTPQPIDIESFVWNRLEATGLTDLGEACLKLNEKLSKNAFMKDGAGNYAPAIILISDGNPTDNYEKGLEALYHNNWFKQAIRVAFAVGSDVRVDMLEKFTGNSDTVIPIHNKSQLRKIIRFVSVRASQIASRSSAISDEERSDSILNSRQKEVIEALNEISLDSNYLDDDIEW